MSSLLIRAGETQRAWKAERLIHRLSPQLPHIVRGCKELILKAPEEEWSIRQAHQSLSEMQVLVIGTNRSQESYILYLPQTARAVSSYEHRAKNLATLHADESLAGWRKLLPRSVYKGEYQGIPFWIVERLPGTELTNLLRNPHKFKDPLRASIEAIQTLHMKTARVIVISEEYLSKWVYKPIQTINESLQLLNSSRSRVRLERVGERLAASLAGRRLNVSWVHGDYWPGNILISSDRMSVTGIVDWEQAHPDELPHLDLINLLISTDREFEGQELGRILVEMLNGKKRNSPLHEFWADIYRSFANSHLDMYDALMIYWLRHLSDNMIKSRHYAINPIWIRWNYRHVLDHVK